jgi:adenosine deaminase
VARLIKEKVALDICPISNVRLAVKGIGSMRDHPIRRLFDAGVTVTVSSDDPFFLNNTLTQEYEALNRDLGFTFSELVQVAENGFRVALVPEHTRKTWLDLLADIAADTALVD